MARILIADDELLVRRYLRKLLVRAQHEVVEAADGHEALALVAQGEVDLVLTDLSMPGLDGIGVLEGLRRMRRRVPAVVLTSSSWIGDAVAAMKAGALDFLSKPVDEHQLELAIRAALAEHDEAGDRLSRGGVGVVGESAAMVDLLAQIEQVGPSEATVLITGETGTGKEVVARLLHAASPRRDHPLVVVNCGAIPDGLVESELFGHAKGAFTGAVARRVGVFVAAERGTLFLDEIGELSLPAQAKLLRVLQERVVTPVGESIATPVDVRVIAATHRDLEQMVDTGAFRQDLYYRLAVVPLDVPPLRERPEDIPPLIHHILHAACARNRRQVGIAEDAVAVLAAYGFPGNVRELENLIERLVIVSRTGEIRAADLPEKLHGPPRIVPPADAGASPPASTGSLDGVLRETEERMIAEAMRQAGGNRTLAAQLLGINRTTLVAKLKRQQGS